MGRAGGAGSGGGRSSGGGHSAGRSGGGHRVGSSGTRAGSGSYGRVGGASRSGGPRGPVGGGPRGGFGGPIMPPPPPPPRRYRYGGYRRRSGGGCSSVVVLTLIVIILMVVGIQSCTASVGSGSAGMMSSDSQKSTIVRNKIDTNNAYINNCVVDELGWFDSVSKTESGLKKFWEETGVQPYIILRDYDASLSGDAEKEQWAMDYYDENFDTENIFLFVYFAEEDTDNDVGYMAYANGYETSSVMDSEAVEIFWNNIDRYWYTNLSTDDVFINAFNDTANTIMHVSTTEKDVMKWVLIVLVVAIAGGVIINLVKQKNQRDKEKAEEDQRILNTPINDMAKDDLEDRYL